MHGFILEGEEEIRERINHAYVDGFSMGGGRGNVARELRARSEGRRKRAADPCVFSTFVRCSAIFGSLCLALLGLGLLKLFFLPDDFVFYTRR